MVFWHTKYVLLCFAVMVAFCTQAEKRAIFKDAPCWVTNLLCIKALDDSPHLAIGISQTKYSQNPQLATYQAQYDATINLGKTIHVDVVSSLTNTVYSRSSETGGDSRTMQQESNINSKISLNGLMFIDKWIDNTGVLYVLVTVNSYERLANMPKYKRSTLIKTESEELNFENIRVNMGYANQLADKISKGVQAFLD